MSSISSIQRVWIDHLSWFVPGALGNMKHGEAAVSAFQEEALL